MEVDELLAGRAGRVALGMGDDEGNAIDLVVHELALLDQLVRAEAVAVIGRIYDDGVVKDAQFLQVRHDASDHVVDERAVAEVARRDFLEPLPAVITQPPHVFDQLLAVGLLLKGLGVPGCSGMAFGSYMEKYGSGTSEGLCGPQKLAHR